MTVQIDELKKAAVTDPPDAKDWDWANAGRKVRVNVGRGLVERVKPHCAKRKVLVSTWVREAICELLEQGFLRSYSLEDVLALRPVPEALAALTLSDVGLASTSLRSLSLASLALGSIPLSSIPLDWCTLLPDCSNLAGTTLMDLDIQGVPGCGAGTGRQSVMRVVTDRQTRHSWTLAALVGHEP